MADLTVIILTRNEENNLRKCVESFKGAARRFVIVDSFSTDRTEELCRALDAELRSIGARLDFYRNEWVDYATQFNWGIQNTSISTKWTMRMDADEELLPELSTEIAEKLDQLPPSVNGVILRRRLIFMGKWIRHGGRYPEYLLRIWRTGKAMCEQKVMDEHMLLLEGVTTRFEYDFADNNQKDLTWWIGKHNWYAGREVQDRQMSMKKALDASTQILGGVSSRQAKAKRFAKDHGYYALPSFFRAHAYFIYRYYFRLGFLDGTEGRVFHFLQAYWYRFLVDAKLYECDKKGIDIKPSGALRA